MSNYIATMLYLMTLSAVMFAAAVFADTVKFNGTIFITHLFKEFPYQGIRVIYKPEVPSDCK